MRAFLFINFLLLLFLKKRTITENADEKDPIKGKINDVGQSSKNYLIHGPDLAC